MAQKKAPIGAQRELDAKVGNFILFPLSFVKKICLGEFQEPLFYGISKFSEQFDISYCKALAGAARLLQKKPDTPLLCAQTKAHLNEILYLKEDAFWENESELKYAWIHELDDDERQEIDNLSMVHAALKSLNLTAGDNAALALLNYHAEDMGGPIVQVSPNWLLDREKQSHIERECMLTALQLGIASIIGMKRKWAFATKDLMKCRMVGFPSQRAFESNEDAEMLRLYERYTSRRIFDSMLKELVKRGWSKTILGTPYRKSIISIYKSFDSIKHEVAGALNKAKDDTAKAQRQELARLKNVHRNVQ